MSRNLTQEEINLRNEYKAALRGLLVQYLRSNPISYNVLADRIGIAAYAIDKFMHNTSRPNSLTLQKIENYLRNLGLYKNE